MLASRRQYATMLDVSTLLLSWLILGLHKSPAGVSSRSHIGPRLPLLPAGFTPAAVIRARLLVCVCVQIHTALDIDIYNPSVGDRCK